eukprot:Protomagalhaensia_wolfi_Nauph_80__3133@NODE_3199_length_860_cov_2_565164_g2507_i0_p1_GENE_NODE_3199_length_860_cov_2_565164_g2507_i0NODE_3199_length_860_cov_2_565164_g2507_i0_p1_ORF_typecomplete_len279_score54_72Nodulin_late/PF07127_11/8_8Nodulin_late/PF07127_11/2_5e02_NODE_3199_length_860_cov_2_565164_g2507_i02838
MSSGGLHVTIPFKSYLSCLYAFKHELAIPGRRSASGEDLVLCVPTEMEAEEVLKAAERMGLVGEILDSEIEEEREDCFFDEDCQQQNEEEDDVFSNVHLLPPYLSAAHSFHLKVRIQRPTTTTTVSHKHSETASNYPNSEPPTVPLMEPSDDIPVPPSMPPPEVVKPARPEMCCSAPPNRSQATAYYDYDDQDEDEDDDDDCKKEDCKTKDHFVKRDPLLCWSQQPEAIFRQRDALWKSPRKISLLEDDDDRSFVFLSRRPMSWRRWWTSITARCCCP